MTEIFNGINDAFKARVDFIYDMMLHQNTIIQAMQALKDFSDTCTEEQQDFIDFYLKLQMEKLKNENTND